MYRAHNCSCIGLKHLTFHCLFLLALNICFVVNDHAEAFDFGQWLGEWHIDIVNPETARITQPAKPVNAEVWDHGRGPTYVPIYTSPIEQVNKADFGITVQVPVVKELPYSLGLHFASQFGGVNHTNTSATLGLYASRPLGFATGITWLGVKPYNLNLETSGAASKGNPGALTVGAGLRTTVLKYLALQAAVEYTGTAVVQNPYCTLNGYTCNLPTGYVPPTVTYHPNTELRLGVGLNLAAILGSDPATRAERNVKAAQAAVHPDVPVEYQPFATAMALSLVTKYGTGILHSGDNSKITWDKATENLIIPIYVPGHYDNAPFLKWANLTPVHKYNRVSYYDHCDTTMCNWVRKGNRVTIMGEVYPPLQNYINQVVTTIAKDISQHRVPKQITFTTSYSVYKRARTTKTVTYTTKVISTNPPISMEVPTVTETPVIEWVDFQAWVQYHLDPVIGIPERVTAVSQVGTEKGNEVQLAY